MATSAPVPTDDLLRGLECPVCHEHYRGPKMLPCGHTLCFSPCLEQIADGKLKVRCPECRTEHEVPEDGIQAFPSNIALARLFDDTKQGPTHPSSGCPVCGEDEMLVQCLHCGLRLCEGCRQNHTVKFKAQVSELFVALKQETATTNLIYETQREEAESTLLKTTEAAVARVEDAAKLVKTIIDDRTAELRRSIEIFLKEELENIGHCFDALQEHSKECTDFCDATLVDLKKKSLTTQSKLAKVKESYEKRRQSVSESKLRINQTLRELNVSIETKTFEEISQTFGHIAISVKDRPQEKDNRETRGEKQADQVKKWSIIDQDMSTLKRTIGSSAAMSEPWGIAVDPRNGDIIVADYSNHQILVFDQTGTLTLQFGSNGKGRDQFNFPLDVAINKDGRIIISDHNNYRIKIHSRDGSCLEVFGQKGSGPGDFDYPHGIAVDADENIHVCDVQNKHVQVFNMHGVFKNKYNSWKNVIDEMPYYIDISESHICVGLAQSVVLLNKNYQHLKHFSLQNSMNGLCWAGTSHVLLSDTDSGIINVYTLDGELVRQSGAAGFCLQKRLCPRGVAIYQGFPYVVDYKGGVVYKF